MHRRRVDPSRERKGLRKVETIVGGRNEGVLISAVQLESSTITPAAACCTIDNCGIVLVARAIGEGSSRWFLDTEGCCQSVAGEGRRVDDVGCVSADIP